MLTPRVLLTGHYIISIIGGSIKDKSSGCLNTADNGEQNKKYSVQFQNKKSGV